MFLKKQPFPEEKKEFVFKIHPELYEQKVIAVQKMAERNMDLVSGNLSPDLAFRILIKSILRLFPQSEPKKSSRN